MSAHVWRVHKQRYEATDATGSLLVSGRYHRGLDDFQSEDTFPALYTSLSPEISLAELVRHTDAATLPNLNNYRLTELAVTLQQVVDCTDPERLGLTFHEMLESTSFYYTQEIGAAVSSVGYEAARVTSASRLGHNLVIFPNNLRSGSRITVIGSRDPRLRIER